MARTTLFYLGPEGTFTHQAALEASRSLSSPGGFDVAAMTDIPSILDAVRRGEGWGVIAWENNVEGYVVPNLDALIDARDLAGFARVGVDVAFQAFVRRGDDPFAHERQSSGSGSDSADDAESRPQVRAHPHGLAQCKGFTARHGLRAVPASSNAAACRDLRPGAVALGPRLCGDLYGLDLFEENVQDFDGARTEFLVVAPRDDVRDLCVKAREAGEEDFETILACILLDTGPGVLADLLDVLRYAGLNMTSFISRPIKGHDGTYSFIATFDAAPWEPRFRTALQQIAGHGDWIKTLAVYPRRERPNPPVDAWMLPEGGVRLDGDDLARGHDWNADGTARRELLW